MYDIFPNYVLRPFYPPMHGVPGSSQRKGIRNSTGTAFYVDRDHPKASDNNKGWDAEFPLLTIQEAIDKAEDGDWIVIMGGAYTQQVTVDKRLTIVGNSRGGSSHILGGDGGVAIRIEESFVVLMNLTLHGGIGIYVHDENNLSVINCRFSTAAMGNSVTIAGGGNLYFEGCVLWGGTNGINLMTKNSVNVVVKDCLFTNISDAHISDGAMQFHRLVVKDSVFEGSPVDFLTINTAGTTGIVTNCSFAHATNQAAVLEIADGVMWVANYTEAGPTTARPA